MTERDPLNALLREWKSPEPSPELDERILRACQAPAWRRLWTARISVPVPVLLAAMVIFALLFWTSSKSTPSLPPNTPGAVTRLNATGFQPLPNGAARVVPVRELRQ